MPKITTFGDIQKPSVKSPSFERLSLKPSITKTGFVPFSGVGYSLQSNKVTKTPSKTQQQQQQANLPAPVPIHNNPPPKSSIIKNCPLCLDYKGWLCAGTHFEETLDSRDTILTGDAFDTLSHVLKDADPDGCGSFVPCPMCNHNELILPDPSAHEDCLFGFWSRHSVELRKIQNGSIDSIVSPPPRVAYANTSKEPSLCRLCLYGKGWLCAGSCFASDQSMQDTVLTKDSFDILSSLLWNASPGGCGTYVPCPMCNQRGVIPSNRCDPGDCLSTFWTSCRSQLQKIQNGFL